MQTTRHSFAASPRTLPPRPWSISGRRCPCRRRLLPPGARPRPCCLSTRTVTSSALLTINRGRHAGSRREVPYGTLDLMVLKTLAAMGPLHGYGIARRIEQAAAGGARAQPGHHLSRAAPARAERLDPQRLGHQREQPARPLLRITSGRPPPAGEGSGAVGAHRVDGQPAPGGSVMTRIRVLMSRVLDLLFSRRRERRLEEEIANHLDLLTEQYVAAGMAPAEARARGAARVRRRRSDQGGASRSARAAARRCARRRTSASRSA